MNNTRTGDIWVAYVEGDFPTSGMGGFKCKIKSLEGTNIVVGLHNVKMGEDAELGFSIKSQLDNGSTLGGWAVKKGRLSPSMLCRDAHLLYFC